MSRSSDVKKEQILMAEQLKDLRGLEDVTVEDITAVVESCTIATLSQISLSLAMIVDILNGGKADE